MNRQDWTSIGLIDRKWHPRLVQRYSRPIGANPLRFLRARLGVWLYGGGLGHGKRSALDMPFLHMSVGSSTVSETGLSVIGQPTHAAGNRSLTLGKMAWKESTMGMRKSQPATQPRTFSDTQLPVFPTSPRNVPPTETTASEVTDTSVQRKPGFLQDQGKTFIRRAPGEPTPTATPLLDQIQNTIEQPLSPSPPEMMAKEEIVRLRSDRTVGTQLWSLPDANHLKEPVSGLQEALQPLSSRLQERRGLSNIKSGRRTLPGEMPLLRRVTSSANPDRMLSAVRFQGEGERSAATPLFNNAQRATEQPLSPSPPEMMAKEEIARQRSDRAVGTQPWSLPEANRSKEPVSSLQKGVQPLSSRLQEQRGLSNIKSGRRTLPGEMPLLRRVTSSANPDRMLSAVRFQSVPTIKRVAKTKSIREDLSSFPGAVAGEVESRPSGWEGFIPWQQDRGGLPNIGSGRQTLPGEMPLLRRVISSANPDGMLTTVHFHGEGERSAVAPLLDQVQRSTEEIVSAAPARKMVKEEIAWPRSDRAVGMRSGFASEGNRPEESISIWQEAVQPLSSRLQERRGPSHIGSGRQTLPGEMPLLRRVISSANPDRILTAVRLHGDVAGDMITLPGIALAGQENLNTSDRIPRSGRGEGKVLDDKAANVPTHLPFQDGIRDFSAVSALTQRRVSESHVSIAPNQSIGLVARPTADNVHGYSVARLPATDNSGVSGWGSSFYGADRRVRPEIPGRTGTLNRIQKEGNVGTKPRRSYDFAALTAARSMVTQVNNASLMFLPEMAPPALDIQQSGSATISRWSDASGPDPGSPFAKLPMPLLASYQADAHKATDGISVQTQVVGSHASSSGFLQRAMPTISESAVAPEAGDMTPSRFNEERTTFGRDQRENLDLEWLANEIYTRLKQRLKADLIVERESMGC